jgi:hypothetical protein
MTSWPTVTRDRRTATLARLRSTSGHWRPSSSPRRILVEAASSQRAWRRSLSTAARNDHSSVAVQTCSSGRPGRGGEASRATLRGTRPHRAASASARRLAKERKDSPRRIDAAVAAVMAHDRAAALAGNVRDGIYI